MARPQRGMVYITPRGIQMDCHARDRARNDNAKGDGGCYRRQAVRVALRERSPPLRRSVGDRGNPASDPDGLPRPAGRARNDKVKRKPLLTQRGYVLVNV